MTGATPPDNKLTATKQRWAEEGRFLTGRGRETVGGRVGGRMGDDRLPPGQHLVKDWPVLDLGVRPAVSVERWTLRVFGAVEEALTWDWATFQAQPQHRAVSDIHCVTTWSRYDNAWEGMSTAAILAAARPKPDVRTVVLHSHDGYTTNLALDDFADPGVMLAHSWEGRPLTREHGGPMRLVAPHLYFWKSAKWLQRIEFTVDPSPGFWEVRGYHDRGDPWQEQRFSDD